MREGGNSKRHFAGDSTLQNTGGGKNDFGLDNKRPAGAFFFFLPFRVLASLNWSEPRPPETNWASVNNAACRDLAAPAGAAGEEEEDPSPVPGCCWRRKRRRRRRGFLPHPQEFIFQAGRRRSPKH